MKYYIIDAFADRLFKGNPAGVCLLGQEWLEDSLMQDIAAENNLSETAFIVECGDHYSLRWFTPKNEVDLCGHATVASAFVISNFVDKSVSEMRFDTKSGMLTVTKDSNLFVLDFPARKPRQIDIAPQMESAIGTHVCEAYISTRDLMLLCESEAQIQNLAPNFEQIKQIADHAVIVTAEGNNADFVSRFFAPNYGIAEDPVTGSAHTVLIPFWADRLGKQKMTARQLSKRGGTLFCENRGERVKIAGKAVLYLAGEIFV